MYIRLLEDNGRFLLVNLTENETRIYKYIGETCRSSYERGAEHLSDMRLIKTGSHLLKHVLDKHFIRKGLISFTEIY